MCIQEQRTEVILTVRPENWTRRKERKQESVTP